MHLDSLHIGMFEYFIERCKKIFAYSYYHHESKECLLLYLMFQFQAIEKIGF